MNLNKDENNEELKDQLIGDAEEAELTDETSELEKVDAAEESDAAEATVENAETDETDETDETEASLEVETELPKPKKNNKKIIGIGLAVVLAIALGAFGYYQMTVQNNNTAVTFDGKKFSVEEYKLYLLFQGDVEGAKETAVTALTESLIVEKAVKDKGFELTEEEKTQVTTDVKNLKDSVVNQGLVMPNISDERLFEIVSTNMYFSKMMDDISKKITIDEAVFATELETYKLNNKQQYADIQLKYILTKTKEEGEKARAEVAGGKAIDEVIKKYSFDFDPTNGVKTVAFKDISLPAEDINEILSLNVAGLTKVITLDGAFAVFSVVEKTIPTDAELKESFKAMYIQNKAYEQFQVDLAKWKEEAKFTVNQKAIDALTTAAK